jgi:DNA-binding CsgD family transcriptional regulator
MNDSELQRPENDESASNWTVSSRSTETNIYRLWDELADFDSGASKEALAHCMGTLCDWIGAQNAFWSGIARMTDKIGNVTDTRHGWRMGGLEFLYPERLTPKQVKVGVQAFHSNDPGAPTLAVLAGAGQFRTHSLGSGMVDMKAFQKTEHYDYFYRRKGVADRLWVAFPVSVDAESVFCFATHDAGRSFNSQELQLASDTLRGIKWFHRQLLLSHNLGVGESPLTPAERRILPLLLSGDNEMIIARQLDLTRGTVHQYATGIYRKYGVSSRTEFMAIWLRGLL